MKYATAVLVVLGLLLGFNPAAQADNTVCEGAILVVPDGSPHEGTLLGAISEEDFDRRFFHFVARSPRSYSIMVENLGPRVPSALIGLDVLPPPEPCNFAMHLGRETGEVEPYSRVGEVGANRASFISPGWGEVFFSLTGEGPFRVRVEETTLFNPGWSTGSGFNTFYSLLNTTANATINATLQLFTIGGTAVTAITIPIPPEQLAATNTVALGVPPGFAGYAILTHDGPPGAILADAAIANFNTTPAAIIPAKFERARQQR